MKRAAKKSCPVCRRPATTPYAPFCSKRCSEVDLGRWLGGQYAFPVRDEEEDEAPPEPAGGSEERD